MLQHGGVIQTKKQIAASAAYKIINRRLKLNSYLVSENPYYRYILTNQRNAEK